VSRKRHLLLLFPALAIAVPLLGGCAATGPEFIEPGSAYTTETVRAALDAPAPAKLNAAQTSDAAKLRHDSLLALRSKGDNARRAADILTETFSKDTSGVPYRIEIATLGGRPVYVVSEAVGRPGQSLTGRRLWVLEADGAIAISLLR
jgi:hypothetical protein